MRKPKKVYQSIMIDFNHTAVSRFVGVFLTLQNSHKIALNHAYNSVAYAMKKKGLEKMPISMPTLQKYIYTPPEKVNSITIKKIEEFLEVGQKYFGFEMEFEPMKHLMVRAKHNYPKNRKSRYDNERTN